MIMAYNDGHLFYTSAERKNSMSDRHPHLLRNDPTPFFSVETRVLSFFVD